VNIHHTQVKKAAKIGVILTATGDGVEAFWPEHGATTNGATPNEALERMRVMQEAIKSGEVESKFTPTMEDVNIHELMPKGEVPKDGGEAYHQGFTAADCPYTSEDDSEYDEFVRWNDEWDAAADEEVPEPTGSVVKPEYRARYAEMGHPTHCGDWLANLLNEQCVGEKETDLIRFESICNANGVSLEKYNRTTNGWQGRLRMTGRNLLKAVVVRAGFILIPNIDGLNDKWEADPEWLAEKAPKKGKNEKADAPSEGVEA
jgi:hypothetical protein